MLRTDNNHLFKGVSHSRTTAAIILATNLVSGLALTSDTEKRQEHPWRTHGLMAVYTLCAARGLLQLRKANAYLNAPAQSNPMASYGHLAGISSTTSATFTALTIEDFIYPPEMNIIMGGLNLTAAGLSFGMNRYCRHQQAKLSANSPQAA